MGSVLIKRRKVMLTASVLNGVPTAQTNEIASDEEMVIDSITLSSTPYVPCVCTLYEGLPSPANFLIQANDGGLDTFEGTIEIMGGSFLSLVWSGVVGESVLTARIHFALYKVVNASYDATLAAWRGPR